MDLENNSMFNFINDGFSRESLNIKEIDDSSFSIEENNNVKAGSFNIPRFALNTSQLLRLLLHKYDSSNIFYHS